MNKNKHLLSGLPKWQFILLMTLMVTVWALAFPFIKIGLEELSFVNLTIMRFFVVCITLTIILLFQRERFSKLRKKDVLPIFLIGVLGVIGYHLGLNYGEQFISPSAASLIIATIPVFVVILAFVFLRERMSLKTFLGVIISLFGVIAISIWGRQNASIDISYVSGALAVLIASLLGAFYTIAGKKLLDRYSALSLTVYAMLLGSLGLIPFVSSSLFEQVANMSSDGWFAVIFLGLFSTVIGYVLWYMALEIKTASEISVYLYAVPVLSTIVSYRWFGDESTLFFIIGGLLVIVGLIIVNLESGKRRGGKNAK
jgi:drug/metabolite transporter (DMT)-like permease